MLSQRRDSIMVSIEQKFYAVRETEFAIDGSEVVGNCDMANVEFARNFFVAQAFAYAADDLVLAFGRDEILAISGGSSVCLRRTKVLSMRSVNARSKQRLPWRLSLWSWRPVPGHNASTGRPLPRSVAPPRESPDWDCR